MHLKYRPEIDGLRALAVLPVILFHAKIEAFSGGYVGVDVFFVISGYLITTIILSEQAEGRFSLVRFYERRARRILPALYLVMACSGVFAWAWMLPLEIKAFGRSLVAASLFSSNVLFWREAGYFAPAMTLKPMLHTWSLAVEEQYYLFFPPLMMLLRRFGTKFLAGFLAAAAVASLAFCEWLRHIEPVANFFLAPTRAWELLAGALCAITLWKREVRPRDALSLLGVAAIAFATFAFDEDTPGPSLYTLVPVSGAALVILFGSASSVTGKLLANRPLVGIGLVSYSAYLWHQPLLAFARIRSAVPPPQSQMLLLAALSLVLGYLAWRFVETPFRRKQGLLLPLRKQLFGAAVGIGMLFVGLGVIAIAEKGFPERLDQRTLAAIDGLDRAAQERLVGIRNLKCHLDTEEIDVDRFLEQWNCRGRDEATLSDAHVAIFGDSVAGDRAWAMRANGQNVLQMSGANCSLIPSRMAPGCQAIADQFKAVISESPSIDRVWLANKYRMPEVRSHEFSELLDYWGDVRVPTYLFTPVPYYYNLRKVYFLGELQHLGAARGVQEQFDENSLSMLAEQRGFLTINTEKLLCAAFPNCVPFLAGAPLLQDPVHLTPNGARLLGQQLVKCAAEPATPRAQRAD